VNMPNELINLVAPTPEPPPLELVESVSLVTSG